MEKGIKMKKIIIVILMVMAIGFPLAFAEGLNEKRIYLVKKGDKPLDIIVTLSVVAQTTPEKIMKWNPDLGLHNISIGQKIQYFVNTGLEKKIDQKTQKISLQINQLEEKINQIGITEGIKNIDDSLRINLNNIRGQIKDNNDIVITKIDQTENQIKNIFLIGGVVFFSIMILVVIFLFIMTKKEIKHREPIKEKLFRITIKGKKYLYSPEKKGDSFISLFRGLKFDSPQDAVKSSAGILKKNPALVQKEIGAGRLKRKT